MVDPKPLDFRWALPHSALKFFDNKDRCIQQRQRSSLPGTSNSRGMDFTGTTTSHKCIGNEGSKTSFTNMSQAFSNKNYSFPNRQYNSLVSSCEDLGGVGTKSKYLMELTKEIWKYLLHHGITITAEYLPGSMNMEAYWYFKPSTSISENLSDKTKTRDGSFCFSTVSLTSTVQCTKIGSIH